MYMYIGHLLNKDSILLCEVGYCEGVTDCIDEGIVC